MDRLQYGIPLLAFLWATFWPGDDPLVSADTALICAVLVWSTYNIVLTLKGGS